MLQMLLEITIYFIDSDIVFMFKFPLDNKEMFLVNLVDSSQSNLRKQYLNSSHLKSVFQTECKSVCDV